MVVHVVIKSPLDTTIYALVLNKSPGALQLGYLNGVHNIGEGSQNGKRNIVNASSANRAHGKGRSKVMENDKST